MVGWCQLSERNCNSVDQLLLLRIQHWGRGGVSPCKHARSSATLFDGKGARFSTLFLTKFVDVTPIFMKLLRNNEALFCPIACGATKKFVLFIKLQDYIIIIFMLGLWAYSIHLILRWINKSLLFVDISIQQGQYSFQKTFIDTDCVPFGVPEDAKYVDCLKCNFRTNTQ